MAVSRYASLGLRDNPFPHVPTVDPTSSDTRMNGSIYNEELFCGQIAALRQRLDRRENLIYAENTRFALGVGKSALITREWRRLREQSPEATVYVRCGHKTQANTVDGACNAIVDAWYRNGALWKALCGLLLKYGREADAPVLNRGVIDNLIALHPKPPRVLSARALMLWDVSGAVGTIARWLEEIAPRVSHDVAVVFLSTMLSKPGKFSEAYARKAKRREVTAFVSILEILQVGGLGHIYIFLDQFEELIHGRGRKELLGLASSMRQILEACPDSATFVVTLHPNAVMALNTPEGQSLTTIAPLDQRRVVDLPNITPPQAVRLAETYLRHFRLDGAECNASTAPFDDDCIELISSERDGNIRQILQTLHYCVAAAVEHGVARIDTEFYRRHHRDITGKVSPQELELE